VGVAVLASLAGVACGGSSDNGGDGGTGPSSPFAVGSGLVTDLMGGSVGNGTMTVQGRPIAIRNGSYSIAEADQVPAGVVPGVLISADGCVIRKTPVTFSGNGAATVDLAYKQAPLDVICDEDAYGKFEKGRGSVLNRFNPNKYRGAFLYDIGEYGAEGDTIVLANRNLMDSALVSYVVHVASNNLSRWSDGKLPNGIRLASQVEESQWPNINDADGYLLFYSGMISDLVATGMRPSDIPGEIKTGVVVFRVGGQFNMQTVCTDTPEALGFADALSNCDSAGNPTQNAETIGKIMYNRPYLQTTCPDARDCVQ
ncbi:hypothetical protein JW826_05705, partial [Candidatus Woesearchaeota archaeon]|nr:hypothetical protein [Candidatus Woesearchaeota archaeon]